MMSEKPIVIDCPFSEKDEVKKLGAKFDWVEKKWFIPPGLEIEPFAKWLPKGSMQPDDNKNKTGISLQELMLSIQTTIAKQHDTRYWVRAEVINVSTHFHVYLELSDHDNDGNEIAKVRATLWNSRANELLERFESLTGMPFKTGIQVLLQVRVEFHPCYGLSLDILDIDPNFTLGAITAKFNQIRERLKKEGIYLQNQKMTKATEFCKVAVVAPQQAAGLGDFKSQADILATINLCQFCYYPASFQGQNAITELPAAIQSVSQDHQSQLFDALVIIRGGGAKADLYQLNEYEIVKAVCTAPFPVIVGIGHERDKTLLDEVANQTFHTPSLVITHISGTIVQNARHAAQNWQLLMKCASEQLNWAKAENERLNAQIREQAVEQLNRAKAENERFNAQIREQVVQLLGRQQQNLNALMQYVKNEAHQQLNQARYQIKGLMEAVLLGDPHQVMKRGYAIVRNNDKKVITKKARAEQEDSLIIEFQDGKIVCQTKRQGKK